MDTNVAGKIVIVKFHGNLNKDNSSKLITRTLGKVGFIDKAYQGPLPKDEELWKAKIVQEVNPGERKGCFIVEPIERLEERKLQKLFQGFYDEVYKDGILFVYPKQEGNWILPLKHRKSISNTYAILVILGNV